jgi:hypothetical protein
MVLYNGSSRARNSTKTINDTRNYGMKMPGSVPSTFMYGTSNRSNANLNRVSHTPPKEPIISDTIVCQRVGYKATLGPK